MYVSPSQITPGESFSVSYFIRNHTDAATYYVRARVYDVQTGEVLATANLSQSSTNTRLYLATLTAPADPLGYGRAIVAIATVYTDSGYSTRSDAYEEQEQAFLVKGAPLLGGGGVDLTGLVERLEASIREEIANIPKPEKVTIPEYPFDSIFGALGAMQREINRIPKREEGEVDPALAKLDTIESLVRALPLPPQIGPIIDRLMELKTALGTLAQTTQGTGATIIREVERVVDALGARILEMVSTGMQEHLSKQELTIPLDKLFKQQATGQEADPRETIARRLM